MTPTATAIATERPVSEPELISRVLAGDRVAARELYDAHAPRVYRLAYRLTGDEELARESTQDVFVRAFRRLGTFRGDAALSTWLHRITLTVVAGTMRKVKRLRERETELEPGFATDADTRAVDPMLREKLHRAIDALPEHYRTTVIMHDIEGYTHLEIAQALGVAEGTSKSRLFLARAQLRAALGRVAEEMDL